LVVGVRGAPNPPPLAARMRRSLSQDACVNHRVISHVDYYDIIYILLSYNASYRNANPTSPLDSSHHHRHMSPPSIRASARGPSPSGCFESRLKWTTPSTSEHLAQGSVELPTSARDAALIPLFCCGFVLSLIPSLS
jgi:hypothetical protein